MDATSTALMDGNASSESDVLAGPIDATFDARALTAETPLYRLAGEMLTRELLALRRHLKDAELRPESVHQARISIRRLRVALRLFASFLGPEAEDFRARLGDLGRALGEVRELDVYADRVATESDGGEALQELVETLSRSGLEARARLRALLQHDRFLDVLPALEAHVATHPSAASLRRWKSLRIGDAASADTRPALRRVLKLGRKVDTDTVPDTLHRLRIRAKQLRYQAELYAAFDPSLTKLAREAKRLQDALGDYRDACQAAERLHSYAVSAPREQIASRAFAVAPLIRREQERASHLRRSFARAWRRFEKRTREYRRA